MADPPPWEDSYKAHSAWEKTNHALDLLRGLSLEDAPESARQHVARAVRCFELVRDQRDQADPHWVDNEALDELDAAAISAAEMADQFSATGNAGHLNQLAAVCDRVLRASRRLVPPDSASVHAVHSSEVEGLRSQLADLRSEIEESASVHRQERNELAQDWQTKLEQLDEALVQTKQSLQALQGEVAVVLESGKEQLEAEEKARSAQAEKDRKARSQAFEEAVEEYRGKFEATLEELSSAAKADSDEIHNEAQKALEQVRQRREEVENEAGAVAVSALGGRLEQTADREDTRAFGWTVAAILIALLVPIGILASAQVERELRLQTVVAAAALVSASGYAARAAGRHRTQGELYRDRENRMKTLLPFTANLDSDEATALKVLAGLDVFAPADEKGSTSDGPAPRHYIEGALRDRVKGRLGRREPEE